MRHDPIQDQQQALDQYLHGHHNYYGIAGNLKCLLRIYNLAEELWRKSRSRRSQKGEVTWEQFQKQKQRFPLARPKLFIKYKDFQTMLNCEACPEERSAANPHATICRRGGWVTAPSTRRVGRCTICWQRALLLPYSSWGFGKPQL